MNGQPSSEVILDQRDAGFPARAVFLDAGSSSDAARINAEQIFREVSPETEVKAI